MTDDFRQRALDWLSEHASRSAEGHDLVDGESVDIAEAKRFQLALFEAGFAGITWPTQYGGQGLGPAELTEFNDVAKDYELPVSPFIIGLGMPGPTILELGSEAQKERYIPPMLRGEEVWCQLFSEPDAGSDIAGLTTTALKTNDGWTLNGQKVWTSGAQHSDFGVVLARTDPSVPKHQGLTMFIVDMHDEAISVRPLVVATGASPFNEVFIDGLTVDDDAVLGDVGSGWNAAVVMLRHERITIGAGTVRSTANPLSFDSLSGLAVELGVADRDDIRQELARLYARETALAAYTRILHEESAAGTPIGARGSAVKLASADFALWSAHLAVEIAGEQLVTGDTRTQGTIWAILSAPGHAIAGGTNEIQRNIVGERILGLAKDPGSDRDIPFNQRASAR